MALAPASPKSSLRFLAVSGSLRRASSNTALLRAAAALAPAGVEVVVYEGLGDLPHFNPDLEEDEPESVTDFRTRIRESDGLLISSPEYAHGVPGVLKNALDWLVGGQEFINKPVALLNASPRATYAQASLTETITVMTGRIVAEASITLPLLGTKLDEAGIVAHPEMSSALREAIEAFARAVFVLEGSDRLIT
jgi:chromate reductase, NAD(P)H dehydrogenase (quinone)